MKQRFLVRKVMQAIPKSACECFESYHSSYNDACNEFDIALFNARAHFYVLIEICEIGDDDEYHPVSSVKLTWF